MKIAVEMLGRVLCVELSAIFCPSQAAPGSERVTVGTAETEVSEDMMQPFGFTYTRKRS